MDNVRLILVITLVFIMMLMYQAWLEDYGQPTTPTTTVSTPNSAIPTGTETTTPTTATDGVDATASALPDTTEASVGGVADLPAAQIERVLETGTRIVVETDVVKIDIDTVGGDIRNISLLDYPIILDEPDNPFLLMDDQGKKLFVAQSGLLPADYAPTHQTTFHTTQTAYHLQDGQDSLDVVLTWQNDKGVTVKKIYTFKRGSYTINVRHQVENNSAEDWKVRLYGQLQRNDTAEADESSFIYTYRGGAISSPEQLYEKISFDDIRNGSFTKENRDPWTGGWAAMLQHYFVAAWIPTPDIAYNYYAKHLQQGNRYILGLFSPVETVTANTQKTFDMQLYAGPKLQDRLESLAHGLDLTVDYGWLWFLAKPLFWLLEAIHGVIGNWGWAIIFVTIIIKLAFFQLSATSYKSMANMRRLQPRLVSLKERYGDDRARLNQAMMDLYKKEKINPLGGCLPILVQIPVFIALYWVLLESVELRQAPFMLWLDDLSSPDPFYILPLIMGATMLLQHHLNPAPIDPVQQKVMLVLPLVFTVFFAFFPSGLVLYWVVNNVLSIAQQWVITKKIAGDV